MPNLSKSQVQVIKAIIRLYETDRVEGRYDLLVVLNDGAGITYGAEQTTENSGGIYRLLEVYREAKGVYAHKFDRFMGKLYDGKDKTKKDALTDDKIFKNTLIAAAKNDPIMRTCQDTYFEKNYLEPAIGICENNDLKLPLSVAIIYDSCIHSGPGDDWDTDSPEGPKGWGAAKMLWDYDEVRPNMPWDEPSDEEIDASEVWTEEDWENAEKQWVKGYVEYRRNWLANHSREAVRATTYRMDAFLDLIAAGKWDLALPFEVRYRGKVRQVTASNTEGIAVQIQVGGEQPAEEGSIAIV